MKPPSLSFAQTDTASTSTMNTELLLKVKSAILAEPRKFTMSQWAGKDEDSPCGTSACIAGHAVAIERGVSKLNEIINADDIEGEAAADIGIASKPGADE